MGLILSKIRFGRKIVVTGLAGCGKTTIISLLQPKNIEVVTPTRGFKVTKIEYNRKNYTMWDLSGDKSMRSFWSCYFKNISGMVYVIDGSNLENRHEALSVLCELGREKSIFRAVFMILVHKVYNQQDFNDLKRNLGYILNNRRYNIFSTMVDEPETIISSFNWFFNTIG